ncbi:MAG: hypothetical protein GJ676_15500 [Rhodobacteraceae bacterium]|nr:hypothetical protein [Paracoccaceae bacterium]
MRPLLHGDVVAAARVLLLCPPDIRQDICDRMIREAQAADIYARRTKRLHPLWGNGSLMSAARKRLLAAEPTFDSVDYCACFELVLRRLVTWRLSQTHS